MRWWWKTDTAKLKKDLRSARAKVRALDGLVAEKVSEITGLKQRVEELEEVERQLQVEVEKFENALMLCEQNVKIQAETIENYLAIRKSENLAIQAGQQFVNGARNAPDKPPVDYPRGG